MSLNLSPAEEKLLKKIGEMNVITKAELKAFLREDGAGKNPDAVLDTSIKNLMQKKFIDTISPVGSTCYVITQIGTRFLRDMV